MATVDKDLQRDYELGEVRTKLHRHRYPEPVHRKLIADSYDGVPQESWSRITETRRAQMAYDNSPRGRVDSLRDDIAWYEANAEESELWTTYYRLTESHLGVGVFEQSTQAARRRISEAKREIIQILTGAVR